MIYTQKSHDIVKNVIKVKVLVFFVLFMCVGAVGAVTIGIASEAENATLLGSASVVSDSRASGGKAVLVQNSTNPEPPNSALNSINRIVYSMQGTHEAYPHGMPSGFDWAYTPSVYIPGSTYFDYITLWGIAYGAANGPGEPYQAFPYNSKIQMRNFRFYILSKKDNKWHAIIDTDGSSVRGRAYPENYSGEPAIHFAFDREPATGGSSAKMIEGRNLYFDNGWYADPLKEFGINPNEDIVAIYGTFQAKLIHDGVNHPDDSATSKVILYTGAEWWDAAPFCGYGCSNKIAAISRATYLSNEWQAFNMHTMSEEAIRANPPPVE